MTRPYITRTTQSIPFAPDDRVPLHEVSWGMVVVFGVVVGVVGLLILLGLLAAFSLFIPGQEQPPSSASLNSDPQSSSYSQGRVL